MNLISLWNVKNLEPPPRNTYKVTNHNLDIETLHEVLTEAFITFKDQAELHEEAALLSRCIYRMKLKFRSDKGLKEMEKMNRALLQYLRMNIPQLLETFCSMVPQNYTRVTYLPTLNMLQYLLVRIQGLAKLLIRLIDSSKAAAEYMELRITIGHFWKVAFVCFGVISKIFVLTKELLKFCCKFYLRLLPFTLELKNVGASWLPIDYSLPQDLKFWLNIDWLDKEEVVEAPKKIIPSIFDYVESDESEVEFCGEYTEIEDEVEIIDEYVEVKEEVEEFKSNKKQLKMVGNKLLCAKEEEEDLGEIIRPNNATKINLKKKQKLQSKATFLYAPTKEEEDLGEPIRPNTNPKMKSKMESKIKPILHQITARELIDRINTFKDLKMFEKNFKNVQKEHPNIFKRIDRLQINMMHSSLKKWLYKAKKNHSDQVKLNFCITKAKEVLKLKLM